MQSTQVQQHVGHLNLTRRVGQAVVLMVAGMEVTVRIGKLEHGRVGLCRKLGDCVPPASSSKRR